MSFLKNHPSLIASLSKIIRHLFRHFLEFFRHYCLIIASFSKLKQRINIASFFVSFSLQNKYSVIPGDNLIRNNYIVYKYCYLVLNEQTFKEGIQSIQKSIIINRSATKVWRISWTFAGSFLWEVFPAKNLALVRRRRDMTGSIYNKPPPMQQELALQIPRGYILIQGHFDCEYRTSLHEWWLEVQNVMHA